MHQEINANIGKKYWTDVFIAKIRPLSPESSLDNIAAFGITERHMWPGSLYAANFMSPRAKEREQYHYESSFQIEQAPSGSLHHLGDLDRAELWAHVKRLSRSMPKEVGDLQNHFCCPVTACGKQLARRDVVNNLSKADQDKVRVARETAGGLCLPLLQSSAMFCMVRGI